MNFYEMQEKAKELNVTKILNDLKGLDVPISNFKKLKLLDVDDDYFTFERDLTNSESSFFREWLKEKIQKGIRRDLGI